ncbi:DNA-binding protein [Robertkochia marina]|uniref:DNA-binding protein n=1 Tax=Robertkochia marina TaxID=1227945 RepID=A0A4S3M188_9FLAO|nr:helix-turn-helix domain-containing protein [Robertkochia marina]THD66827.1 DNA-binding protein [Robertkochia marina]TRZ40894.1 DNA-binding protein [Robertkochia marina]
MHNVVLSPIDPEQLINSIAERVSKNILKDLEGITSTSEPSDQILTAEEAAKFLNLQLPTIYSKVSRGELPVMKNGKRLYFSKADLIAHLKGSRSKSFSEIEKDAESYFINKKKG